MVMVTGWENELYEIDGQSKRLEGSSSGILEFYQEYIRVARVHKNILEYIRVR